MKTIITITLVAISIINTNAQNPYEDFGYKSRIVYENKKADLFRVANPDTANEIKAMAFNFEKHIVYPLLARTCSA